MVSVVYLALQVRQNTRSLRADSYARALARISGIQSQLSRDGALADLLTRGVVDVAALTPQERIRFTWIFYEIFGSFEFMFHQAGARALPPEVWSRWSATVAWWLSWPGVRIWWHARPAPFSAGFESFVDGLVQSRSHDAAAARRWQEFVEGTSQGDA